jgi:hypothetical protein
MFFDGKLNSWTEEDPQVVFPLLEAFAGPAQGPCVDAPPSAAVSLSLFGVKCHVDKILAVWHIANRMVPVSLIGTTGSLPRIDFPGRT